jgi:voltage-gated potassium channel
MALDARTGPYALFMLGLSVYVLGALAAQALLALEPETVRILDRADFAICGFFLLDFVLCVVRAPDRRRYLVRWGWLDLISSIPAVDVLRWGRAARAFRILRVMRGLRATRILTGFALERRAESALFAALLLAILVTIFASISILHLEVAADSNIRDADDALWWAFVTITTVGYGDHFPVTPSGRLLAAFLMAAGITLFGTFTAFVASAFLGHGEARQTEELEALRREVRALHEKLEAGRSSEPD